MSNDAKKRKDELARIKSDEGFIRQAYLDAGGKSQDRHHNACLACNSSSALSFCCDKGRWYFNCHVCGESGTVVDVVMLWKKCKSDEAISYVLERYGGMSAAAPAGKKEKQKELKTHADPDSCFEAAKWGLQQREPGAVFVRNEIYPAKYLRANGEPFGQVGRFDIPREDESGKYVDKEFRPITFWGTGWKLTAKNRQGEKWPMLFLPKIMKALKEAKGN